jgi:hypothetical protein
MGVVSRAVACLAGISLAAANVQSPGLQKCLDIKQKCTDGTDDDCKKRQTVKEMKKDDEPINVQLYACHHKQNQDFSFEGGVLKSLSLGKCVAADKAEANSNVNLVACKDGDKLQQWTLTAMNALQLSGTKQCLDVKAELKDGKREKWSEIKAHKVVNVQLYTCHDADTERVNQLWSFAPTLSKAQKKNLGVSRLFALLNISDEHSPAGYAPLAGAAAAAGLAVVSFVVGRRSLRRSSVTDMDMEMLGDQ